MSDPKSLHRQPGSLSNWWVALSFGRRTIALWGDGKRDDWQNSEMHRGPVFGLMVGRLDYDKERTL